MTPHIVVIAHNIRSTHNIGSIFRTCDGFGVSHLYLSGYSPYPTTGKETRLPHIHQKLTQQIHKTALGAEATIAFTHHEQIEDVIAQLRQENYSIIALEQDPLSQPPAAIPRHDRIALLLGEEVNGIEKQVLAGADYIMEIPMRGQKESFNVSVATGIALYALNMI